MLLSRRQAVFRISATALTLGTPARADIPRVERIRARVRPELDALYAEAGLEFPAKRLFLRAFKHERVLEMWGANRDEDPMALIESYPICAASGTLGPKRRWGDEQVPEGTYHIHRFNGWSGFHMSLRVDYPNDSDRARGKRGAYGGAIMVHGDCVSIGCIAIENAPIERVFVSVLASHRKGRRKVPIHIFPTRFDTRGLEHLAPLRTSDPDRDRLWTELQRVHDAFESRRRVPEVRIDTKTGAYAVVRTRPDHATANANRNGTTRSHTVPAVAGTQ